MQNFKKNIAIIGAGLVGSLLSIYLNKRGYNVSVFERRPDLRKNIVLKGRSINMALSNRGIRALNEVGLGEHLRQVAVPMNGRMIHPTHGDTNFQPYGEQQQYINSISRNGLNMFLLEQAEKSGVEFYFEHQCLHVDFEKTEVTLQHFSSITHKKFDIIIGADGANSAVRNDMQALDRFEFSQHFIEHGYKELRIPTNHEGKSQLHKNALHIWPRESFMLIALPNTDNTFTCTLFLPFEGNPSFKKLKAEGDAQTFFEKTFPEAVALMPTLAEDFRDNPTAPMVTVKCSPWFVKNVLLIGDAAHAIVPFFGQGMNAGFEDCRILNNLLDRLDDNWEAVLREFQHLRKPDADAIAGLALDNFIEMRDLVADKNFIVRKQIEAALHQQYPEKWIPLYSMVAFHDEMRYSEAKSIGEKQRKIMDDVIRNINLQDSWQGQINLEEIIKRV